MASHARNSMAVTTGHCSMVISRVDLIVQELNGYDIKVYVAGLQKQSGLDVECIM